MPVQPPGDSEPPAGEPLCDGGESRRRSQSSLDLPNSVTLWEADPRPPHSHKYYHFTAFALALNERRPGEPLCPTDCRSAAGRDRVCPV